MKKLAVFLAFAGLFSFMSPQTIKAEDSNPCYTIRITCDDEQVATAIVCSWEDVVYWNEVYCPGSAS